MLCQPQTVPILFVKLHDAQIRAALGLPVGEMDASIYMQQQRELQREFQLRQLLLQEQFSGHSRLDSMFAENRMKQLRDQLEEYPELQQHYSQLLLQERFQHGQHQDPTLFARAQLQHHLAQTQAQAQLGTVSQQAAGLMLGQVDSSAKDAHTRASSHPVLKSTETISGKAAKKNQTEKRAVATPDDDVAGNSSAPKKRPRAGTDDTMDGKKKKKEKALRNSSQDVSSALAQLGKAAADAANSPLKPPAQDLLDFASSCPSLPEKPVSRGSVSDLLLAAESDEKTNAAGSILIEIKAQDAVAWQDSSPADTFSEIERARARGESIDLPNFSSVLPQLPQEPEIVLPLILTERKKRRKHKTLLDSDSLNGSSKSKGGGEAEAANKSIVEMQTIAPPAFDSTHPIDPWWPSVADIRKERKAVGAPQDDDSAEDEEEEGIFGLDVPFRANVSRIKERFANDVAPGVLEKLPHCRVHQLSLDSKKGMMLPEPVHCFQVTELYPKELMVCCSHCGSWRHAACGGHHKPYSVRECVEVPFTAVCDRCHAEEKLLREYPTAKKRLDRQRNEQLRRAMSTSATIRQLSFSKHGGSYKWPLGSVSTTHIGGHTRSVHVRQEKAEKQWKEMVTKLSKDYGAKTKERVRTRTRELEKLLSSVEDAGTKRAGGVNKWMLESTLVSHTLYLVVLQRVTLNVTI